jgi:hypothetical protein
MDFRYSRLPVLAFNEPQNIKSSVMGSDEDIDVVLRPCTDTVTFVDASSPID